MKNFNLDYFLIDLQDQLQHIEVSNLNSNVNDDYEQLLSVYEFLLNKHAPL